MTKKTLIKNFLGNFIHSKKNPGVNLKKNLQVLQDYFLLKASIPSLFDSIMEEPEEIEIQVALEVHAILNDPLPNEHEKLLADLLDVEDVNGSYINDFELDGFKFIPENRTRANAEKINSWGLFEVSLLLNIFLPSMKERKLFLPLSV